MTIRLPHWLAGLLLRWRFPRHTIQPHPAELLPTPAQGELHRLKMRVNELMRENDELRKVAAMGPRKMDIALIKQADNAQAQANKFRRIKETVLQMKVLYGQIPAYLASLPKAGFSQYQKAAIEDMQHAAEVIGAIDPDLFGLSRAEVQRVIEQKQLARAVLAGVDIVNALPADHNPQTSNNGALTHDDTRQAQAQTQNQGASAGSSAQGSETRQAQQKEES